MRKGWKVAAGKGSVRERERWSGRGCKPADFFPFPFFKRLFPITIPIFFHFINSLSYYLFHARYGRTKGILREWPRLPYDDKKKFASLFFCSFVAMMMMERIWKHDCRAVFRILFVDSFFFYLFILFFFFRRWFQLMTKRLHRSDQLSSWKSRKYCDMIYFWPPIETLLILKFDRIGYSLITFLLVEKRL